MICAEPKLIPVPTEHADKPEVLLILGRMAMNARLIEEWSPGTCASCRHRRTRQSGWQTIHECEHPNLKLFHDGDGSTITLLDFGCRQHEPHESSSR